MEDDTGSCELCGAPLPDDGWFALEVARPTTDQDERAGRTDYLDVAFCSQEHAARWLSRPLPPPESVITSPESRWWRVAEAAFIALGLLVLVLAVVGGVVVLHWLRGG